MTLLNAGQSCFHRCCVLDDGVTFEADGTSNAKRCSSAGTQDCHAGYCGSGACCSRDVAYSNGPCSIDGDALPGCSGHACCVERMAVFSPSPPPPSPQPSPMLALLPTAPPPPASPVLAGASVPDVAADVDHLLGSLTMVTLPSSAAVSGASGRAAVSGAIFGTVLFALLLLWHACVAWWSARRRRVHHRVGSTARTATYGRLASNDRTDPGSWCERVEPSHEPLPVDLPACRELCVRVHAGAVDGRPLSVSVPLDGLASALELKEVVWSVSAPLLSACGVSIPAPEQLQLCLAGVDGRRWDLTALAVAARQERRPLLEGVTDVWLVH